MLLLAGALAGTALWDMSHRAGGAPADGGRPPIEWAAFEGGYGIDFFETVSNHFEDRHPDRRVDFWGNPRLDIQLQLRLLAGEALSARTLTPDQFCRQVESAAARIRKEQADPNGWDDLAKVGLRGPMR